MTEKEITKMMQALDFSREEAIQIIKDDEEIDKGAKLFELTADQKKNAKAMTKTGTKTVKGAVKRERKPDEEKQMIISEIAKFLKTNDEFSVAIFNKEREISLIVGENDYSITLTKHRPPKK